jgi:NitT/TauT family transport system ATP-binding protein
MSKQESDTTMRSENRQQNSDNGFGDPEGGPDGAQGDRDVDGQHGQRARVTGEPLVEIDDLTKIYDPDGANVTAVENLDLEIGDNEFVCVLGPSGCGKSTLMECIAGYLDPTGGEVLVNGDVVREPDPNRGVVFQSNRLFPWKTIGENARFGPQMRNAVDDDRIQGLLDDTGLTGFEDAYPHELSGGMQQRAELVRLLANDPDIMLMDEPFSGLDAMTKELMQEMLLDIWEEEDRTVLFITHDVEEAIFLADRVVVMTARPGQIKDIIDVDLDRPRDSSMLTTDTFNEYRKRASGLIHDEAERAMEQKQQETRGG